MKNFPFDLQVHPPERGRPRRDVTLACGCCCCCCCCLHTVGSLVGAAVAPAFGNKPAPTRYRMLVEEYDFDETVPAGSPDPALLAKRGPSGVGVYWWLVLALTVGAILLGCWADRKEGFVIGLIGVALGLPVLQLFAGIGSLLVVGLSSGADKSYQMFQVGKMLLGTLLGTVVGIVTMVGLAYLISVLH